MNTVNWNLGGPPRGDLSAQRILQTLARTLVVAVLLAIHQSVPLDLCADETARTSLLRDLVLERVAPEVGAPALDQNGDGVVDVSDVIRRARSYSMSSQGMWLVLLSFDSVAHGASNRLLSASVVYPVYFDLVEQSDGAYRGQVRRARGFDPTKNLMEQIGADKQALRPEYEPASWIPLGWPVTATLSPNEEVLRVNLEAVPVEAKDTNPANPFPVALTRSLEAVFEGVPALGDMVEGTAWESTLGLHADGHAVALIGTATMFYCGDVPATQPTTRVAASSTTVLEPGAQFMDPEWDQEDESADPELGSRSRVTLMGPPWPTLPLSLGYPSRDTVIAYSWYDNRFCPAGAPWNPEALFLGGAGHVFSGAAAESGAHGGTVLSLGQPFAGPGFMVDISPLEVFAKDLRDRSTLFYGTPEIIRGTVAMQPSDFNVNDLLEAERQYVSLIAARPYDDAGVIGLLECRIRLATAYNLAADRLLLDLYKYRYTVTEASDMGTAILAQETNLLRQAVSYATTSGQAMLSLYADPQFRGVGAFLRRELLPPPGGALDAKLAEATRIATESGRRLAEIRLKLVEKRLILGFYQAGQRDLALEELTDLQSWLMEAVRVIAAFSETTGFGATGVGVLYSRFEQAKKLESDIRAGYNHLGFHPDFVPFLEGIDLQDQRSTVRKLKDWAAGTVLPLAKQDEQNTENSRAEFTTARTQYETRVREIKNSGYDRLKALCGVIQNPNPSSTQPPYEPDLFTFLSPDTTTRASQVAELLPGWSVTSYGQISIQYQNIENAHTRIEQAVNDIENLVREMEIHEETAQTIAGNMDLVAELYLANGQKIGLLTRQKGILQQQKALEAANKARKNSRFGKGVDLFNSAAKKVPGGKITVTAALAYVAICYPGVATGMLSFMSGTPPPVPAGPPPVAAAQAAQGATQMGINLIDEYFKFKNTLDQAKISGQLAIDQADIDAQIEEIRAIERAQVVYAEKRNMLARTEEQLKILALRQANLGLALQIAQRDAIKEEMQLANMIGEAVSLMADISRSLRQEDELSRDSWCPDWRAVFYASQTDAEASFRWAQGACFMVLRALDYHLNQSQNLQTDYQLLYRARRVRDLELVLASVEQHLVLSQIAVSPPAQATLSLKYDLLSRQPVSGDLINGNPTEIPGSTNFTYIDRVTGQVVSGAFAYQARLRDFLKSNLTREPRTGGGYRYVLEFAFATDLLPAPPPKEMTNGGGFYILPSRENPFWDSGLTVNQVVLGQVFSEYPESQTYQGTTVNLTGTGLPTTACKVRLSMAGNLYQRKAFSPDDPTVGIVAYSTYNQQFPNSLKLSSDTTPPPFYSFSSLRTAVCSAKVNGMQVGGVNPRVLAFTDRAVACDRWVCRITTDDGGGNAEFLGNLYNRVEQPATQFNYVTDLQFQIGWIAKFNQPL